MCIYKRSVLLMICFIFQLITPAFAKAVGVFIYDKNEKDISKEAAKVGAAAIGVASIQEAAEKLPNHPDFVVLAGHGASGIIGLGSGTEPGYHKGLDLKVDKLQDVKENLKSINNKLKEDTIILLSGCNTGAGVDGQNLTVQLAQLEDSKKAQPQYLPNAIVYANKQCVGIKYLNGKLCTYEGNKSWQQSSIVGANKNGKITIGREDVGRIQKASCVIGP